MLNYETQSIISEALNVTTEMNPQATDGTWLEDLTVQAGATHQGMGYRPVLPLVRMAGAGTPLSQ